MKIVISLLLLSTGLSAAKTSSDESVCLLPGYQNNNDDPSTIWPPYKKIDVKDIDPRVIDVIKQKLASEEKKFDKVVCARIEVNKGDSRIYVLQVNIGDLYEVIINASGKVTLEKLFPLA